MAYKPDYGLKLLQDGVSNEASIHFPQFVIYSITVLDYEKYSTMVEIPYDNQVYAVSIDFTQEQLQEMMTQANSFFEPEQQSELSRWVVANQIGSPDPSLEAIFNRFNNFNQRMFGVLAALAS
jgi:hypothetical protein